MEKVYVVIDGKMLGYEEEKLKYDAQHGEGDADFDKYCYENNYAVTGEICSPTEYCKKAGVDADITDDISVADFDEAVADEYGYWNYCLEDGSETVENELTVIPVKFSDGTIRLVETGDEFYYESEDD